MSYISLHPKFFVHEGFGTLMSHYASLYSIYRDIGYKPTILDIDFLSRGMSSAMLSFNKSYKNILYHQNIFPNLKNVFTILKESEVDINANWGILALNNLNYIDILKTIYKYINHANLLIDWNVNNNLYNRYIYEICNFLYVFDDIFLNECKKLLPITDKEIIGICVRDEYRYLNTNHIKLTLRYYELSMNFFDKYNSKFLIFSDDIENTKSRFKHLESKFDIEYTNKMQSAVGLCLMSLCDHCICANSSFSYWASMLNKNKNKKIICSCKFMNNDQKINYKWYPPDWIAIDII